jgi:hypothetical protein
MRYGQIKKFVDKCIEKKKEGKKINRFIVNLSWFYINLIISYHKNKIKLYKHINI